MKYILNIGLNNTNYSKVVEQINNARGHYFNDYHIKQVVSSYNNEIEPTAVLTFDTEAHYTSVLNLVRGWCKVLNQVCIAINISNDLQSSNHLIYDPSFRGEKIKFNSKYFMK